ncbi:uncharacterized protein LOC117329717 [Pecten maximus]|uniref:uncharacterized protein LOC117329717 n=1 Tax=Pecten maximus TaxID=6579 RepID=UPI00145835A3|nr:uncharacterized protein LOC117329717 [Pecten maximus]XP_033743698.1 uncharacterized protein LOC117329717 [Pecten maximus]
MAESISSIRKGKTSLNSSISSFSCISGDTSSDVFRKQIPSVKKKTKKKRLKTLQKRHSQIRTEENTGERMQNDSSIFKRLSNLFKKTKPKQFSHSTPGDNANAIMNRDGSRASRTDFDEDIANDDIRTVFRETTGDDNCDLPGRNLMVAKHSDRSADIDATAYNVSPRVINVKSNSPLEEDIKTQPRVTCHLETEESRSELEEKLKEISRRELELSRKEDEISMREKEVLTSQHNTIETLNEVAQIIGNIAQNPLYVNMAGCRDIHIGTGNEDVKQNLKYVCTILDSLCEKYEDIKNTTETTLESVKTIQKESTDQSEQLHNLADFLESKLKHHTEAEEPHQIPTPSNNVQEQGQICSQCYGACCRPSNNIWKPSKVQDFMVSSQVYLEQNMKQLLTDVQLIKRNLLPQS